MSLLSYIHNLWIVPSHKIIITDKNYGIGSYHDTDYKMLYANFQLLVDYVEIECASMNSQHFNTPFQKVISALQLLPILSWLIPPVRNRLQGLHYLRWEMNLKDESHDQSLSAHITYDLYYWWVKERPSRIDPWENSVDFSDVFDNAEKNGGIMTLTPIQKHSLDATREIQDKYDKEDNEMLETLINHRTHLWT